MEYFILTSGEYTKQLNSAALVSLVPQRLLTKQQASCLDDTNIVMINNKGDEPYPDLITSPAYVISDGMKALFAKYDRTLLLKALRLVDQRTGKQLLYWIMGLDELDCLSAQTTFSRTGIIHKLVLKQAKIGEKAIFKIGGIQEKYLVIRLDVAESLLRRPFYGLELKSIVMEEEWEELEYAVLHQT